MKDYRTYLKAAGVKPIPKNLRTVKKPGDVEIVFCPKAKDWVRRVVVDRIAA
jgi:hypothetical protein